jgi:transcriptional regulator with XRE-family HTH domain
MSVGKSPNAVAAALDIASGTVSGWKKKSALPRQSTLKKIADYFGVSVDDLISEDLCKKKKPILFSENEPCESYTLELTDLRPDEIAKVRAFVAGLKASRAL